MFKLSVVQSVKAGEALQFFLPFQPPGVYNAIVLDRVRRSSAKGQKQAKLLSSCATTGNPDLLGSSMLVASQLMRGTQELYRVDLYAFAGEEGPRRQWCHEAAFYPSPNAVIVAGSVHFRSGLTIRLFDFANDRVLAEYLMSSHPSTRGYKAQGIRFVDEQYFVADLTSFVSLRR